MHKCNVQKSTAPCGPFNGTVRPKRQSDYQHVLQVPGGQCGATSDAGNAGAAAVQHGTESIVCLAAALAPQLNLHCERVPEQADQRCMTGAQAGNGCPRAASWALAKLYAMQALAKERPEDPVEFLAAYLVKHNPRKSS